MGSTRPRAVRSLATLAVFLVIAAGCQANPVGSLTASSPIIASQAVPTQAPASPSSAAVATPAATRTPGPTPSYPTVMTRPTGLAIDGTCDAGYACLGLLRTAKHHSAVFAPGFSFTMPVAGWQNTIDNGGIVDFLPIAEPGDSIAFFRDPQADKPYGAIDTSIAPDVDSLSGWLATNPLLSVSAPVDVSVGGLDGVRVDVAVAPDAASHQSDCPVATCVYFFHVADPSSAWAWDFGVASSERQRLYLLQAKDGVVAIVADSLDGTTWDDLTATTQKLLKSVKFDKS